MNMSGFSSPIYGFVYVHWPKFHHQQMSTKIPQPWRVPSVWAVVTTARWLHCTRLTTSSPPFRFCFGVGKAEGRFFYAFFCFWRGGEGICSMTLTNLNFGQVLLAMRRVHHVHHQCFVFWKVTKDMNALVWVDKLTWERQTVMYHRISHQEFLRSPRFKNTLSKGNAESFLLRMPNLK